MGFKLPFPILWQYLDGFESHSPCEWFKGIAKYPQSLYPLVI